MRQRPFRDGGPRAAIAAGACAAADPCAAAPIAAGATGTAGSFGGADARPSFDMESVLRRLDVLEQIVNAPKKDDAA
jgi:hypothetical protein